MPQIRADLVRAWEGFHLVEASRPIGFGLAPIPLEPMLALLGSWRIDDEAERAELLRFWRAMDSAFIVAWRKAHPPKKEG